MSQNYITELIYIIFQSLFYSFVSPVWFFFSMHMTYQIVYIFSFRLGTLKSVQFEYFFLVLCFSCKKLNIPKLKGRMLYGILKTISFQ